MVLTLERKAFLSNFATSIIAQFHLSLLSPESNAPHENASSGRTLPKDKAEKLRSPTTMPVSSSTLDTIQGDFTA
ncbi:hypothetical protein HAV15_010613 [Penicillium sp. str. |nr:hypothetical protein HAV15_010613 [Penicillium sp. str. \